MSLINFFKEMWNAVFGLLVGAGKFFGYSTVAAAVRGLAITPLASFLGGLCTMITNAICDFSTLSAKAAVGLIAIDIGSGDSLFEQLVTCMPWAISIMQVLGVGLLAFFYVAGLIRCITSPSNVAETPFRLTCNTLIAGLLVFWGTDLVSIIGNFFSLIYTSVANLFVFDSLKFSSFVLAIEEFIERELSDFAYRGQMKTLVASIFTLFLVIMVFSVYFKFILEVFQRYVVLAALILTTPAAVTLAATKSTRISFAKWVRMVASQFILMITNIMFLAVFFHAVNTFGSSILAFQFPVLSSGTMTVVTWCIALYGLIYCASKMDSYLKTMGLSVAETGATMIASMTGDVMEAVHFLSEQGGKAIVKGATHKIQAPSSPSEGSPSPAVKMQERQAIRSLQQCQKERSYTTKGLNQVIDSMPVGMEHYGGHPMGNLVLSELRGVPRRVSDRFDSNTCTARRGIISMATIPDKQGRKMGVHFLTKEKATEMNLTDSPSREVRIGGREYYAIPHGDPSLCRNFLVGNSKMRKEMEVRHSGQATQVFKSQGDRKWSAGAYRITEPRVQDQNEGISPAPITKDSSSKEAGTWLNGDMDTVILDSRSGPVNPISHAIPNEEGFEAHMTNQMPTVAGAEASIPASGNIINMQTTRISNTGTTPITIREYVPTTAFKADILLGAAKERIGGIDYWCYEVPVMKHSDGTFSGLCENSIMPSDQLDRQEWFDIQFPSLANDGFAPAGEESGFIYRLKKENREYKMAPISLYKLTDDAALSYIVYAENGCKYGVAECKTDAPIFVKRDPDAHVVFAEEKQYSDSFKTVIEEQSPEIVKGAKSFSLSAWQAKKNQEVR